MSTRYVLTLMKTESFLLPITKISLRKTYDK